MCDDLKSIIGIITEKKTSQNIFFFNSHVTQKVDGRVFNAVHLLSTFTRYRWSLSFPTQSIFFRQKVNVCVFFSHKIKILSHQGLQCVITKWLKNDVAVVITLRVSERCYFFSNMANSWTITIVLSYLARKLIEFQQKVLHTKYCGILCMSFFFVYFPIVDSQKTNS